MKLKKIIIQGFKSFADRTEINFKDGVTAIVGPNGSGKSNISDAIRWVLGEQSVKTLRGAKMEDIIFAGTDKRKALGYAEVTIVFNNYMGKIPIDYKEVAVTRRMFRSGESEYYLNKNSCRLKDIRELFMDTGIGKDGYSIIGQGRIDEILSNRPEDRRSIFEEAAGIVKYKSKKQEAEKKLEKTEENNSRIKDIIFELEKRKNNLEKESEKALDYREKFDRLKEIETSVYYYEIAGALEQINGFIMEKVDINEKYNKSIENKEEILKEFDLSKGKIEKNNLELDNIRNNKEEISKEIDKINNQILILNEKENYSNKELERLESEKTNLVEIIGTLGREIVSFEKELYQMERSFEEENKRYDEKGLEVSYKIKELKELESKIEQEKNVLITTYNKLSDLKSEINSIKSFRGNIINRLEKIKKELDSIKEEAVKLEEEYLELKRSNEQIEKEKDGLKRNYSKKSLEREENYNYIKDLDIDLNKLKNNLSSKSSNLSMLKNMEETYEGYYKGVKEVLKEVERNNKIKEGFLGVVAEVFSVDEKYEVAIETALGSNAQNIITRDEYFAKMIIEYLKSSRLGRVTCLPINTIKGNIIDIASINNEEFGILGLASDLINYDYIYENIFKNLLGRTLIVDNINNAIKFSRTTNQRYRIVALDGSILNPGGSMTGGSRLGGNTGIIGRKNRIDELELEIKALIDEVNSLEKLKNIKILTLSELDLEIEELVDSIKTNDYNNIELKNGLEHSLRDYERINKSIENQEKEKKVLEEELKKQEDSIKKLELEILEIEREIKTKNDNIEVLNKNLSINKDSNDEDVRLYTEFKIELNKQKNNLDNIIKDINSKKHELGNKKELVLSIDLKIEKIILELEEMSKKITVLKDEMLKYKNMEVIIKENLEEKNLKNKELLDNFYLEQERLNDINDVVSKNENSLRNLELEINKMNLLKENNIKKLLEDYEIEYSYNDKISIEELDLKSLKEEIQELKKYIRTLGTINLGSIEEFVAVDERLHFMTEQRDDLEKAKKDLDRVIVDMEKKMKIQFKECFDEINKNFKEIFKVLFNGGKAELILEKPEDILNTGIDVKAQPPGKKQQSLSLLSGGERSLTAVALLFAMLEMRPSPFCILDEIDAALDEANIGRYTNYLSSFEDSTQFVMITHRKTTMEMADVLYGVTMEEDGVSKILSVELSDKEKIEQIVS